MSTAPKLGVLTNGGKLCSTALHDTFTRKGPLEDYLVRMQHELSG